MNRDALKNYIEETYDIRPDYPWKKFTNYCVFRHKDSTKWFALVMDVEANKLADATKTDQELGQNKIDVIDLKVAPELVGSLRAEKNIYPAYHMNKEHWISIKLDSDFSDRELKSLLEESYKRTKK